MKKLFFAVLTVFAFLTVNAQDFHFGAKAGVNFSTFVGDGADGADGRTNFHVGAVGNVKISDVFAVQPEILFSAQGAEFTEEGTTVEFKYNYINVPILADFTVTDGLSFQAGPQFGFLINDEAEAGGVTVDLDDLGIDSKGFDFGAAVGAQYRLPSIDLFFQARYTFGLSEIADDADSQNSVFSVSVGYFFL